MVMVEVAEDGSILTEGAEAGAGVAQRGARKLKLVAVSEEGVIMDEDAEGALAAARHGKAQLMVAEVGDDGSVVAESVEAAAGLSKRGEKALQVVEIAAGSPPAEVVEDEAGRGARPSPAPVPPQLKLQRTASFPGADPPPIPKDPSLQNQEGFFSSGLEISGMEHSVVGSTQPAASRGAPPTAPPTQPAAEKAAARAPSGTDVALGMQQMALGGTDVTAAPGDEIIAAAARGGAPSAEMMSEGAGLQMSWDGGVQQAPVTGELQMSDGGGPGFGSVSTSLEGGAVSHGLSADEALRRKQETLDGP